MKRTRSNELSTLFDKCARIDDTFTRPTNPVPRKRSRDHPREDVYYSQQEVDQLLHQLKIQHKRELYLQSIQLRKECEYRLQALGPLSHECSYIL